MDGVSSLLFVSVVVAWAVYLIPKAVQHHDEAVRSRSIERFSQSMRVLARREPVNRRDSRLVVQPGRGAAAPVVTTKGGPSAGAQEVERRREARRRATRRRRRVLAVLLLALAAVATTAGVGLHSWWYVAIPGTLVATWLVMCRVMVKGEQGAYAAPVRRVTPTAPTASRVPTGPTPEGERRADDFAEAHTDAHGMPVVRDPKLWDPVPVTLPTYVDKEPATRRTVSTIDLDSTGVFSAGRSATDSALAREAEETERERKAARIEAQRRATGS